MLGPPRPKIAPGRPGAGRKIEKGQGRGAGRGVTLGARGGAGQEIGDDPALVFSLGGITQIIGKKLGMIIIS